VYALPDRFLVVSYAMIRERLIEALDKYIIMDDVTLEDATEMLAVLGVEGPHSEEVLRATSGLEFDSLAELGHRETQIAGIPIRVVRRSPGTPGFECIVARDQLEQIWGALLPAVRSARGGPVGYAALNSVRLEAGIPWYGYDFDESVIPHEAGIVDTHVSFTKGCYTGQEIVERVRSRGHVNRGRAGFAFMGGADAIPAAGTKLLVDGKDVGHVTRTGFSPAIGHPIGMGYIRREYSGPGTALQYSGGTARVITLPLPR
jgi:folate-binding protein YgfZ